MAQRLDVGLVVTTTRLKVDDVIPDGGQGCAPYGSTGPAEGLQREQTLSELLKPAATDTGHWT